MQSVHITTNGVSLNTAQARCTQLLTKLILDAGSLIASKVIPDDPTLRRKIDDISRRLCFSLHSGRTFLINTR